MKEKETDRRLGVPDRSNLLRFGIWAAVLARGFELCKLSRSRSWRYLQQRWTWYCRLQVCNLANSPAYTNIVVLSIRGLWRVLRIDAWLLHLECSFENFSSAIDLIVILKQITLLDILARRCMILKSMLLCHVVHWPCSGVSTTIALSSSELHQVDKVPCRLVSVWRCPRQGDPHHRRILWHWRGLRLRCLPTNRSSSSSSRFCLPEMLLSSSGFQFLREFASIRCFLQW